MKGVDPNYVWILYDESNGNALDTYVWTCATYGRAVRHKVLNQIDEGARLSEPRRVGTGLINANYTKVVEKDGDTYWRRNG